MKRINITSASRPHRGTRVINFGAAGALLALLWGLLPAATAASTESNGAPPLMAPTNGITAQIQTDLDAVKAKMDSAVKTLQQAVASNQDHGAAAVSNLATQIRTLAQNDLGDTGRLVTETDRLIQKWKDSISHGRMLAADPKEESREVYAQALLTLEPELAQLIDRRTSVARVRAELIRQAGALESRARAIAWLDDVNEMKVASQALENALSEALAFAGRIDSMLMQLGKGQPLALQ